MDVLTILRKPSHYTLDLKQVSYYLKIPVAFSCFNHKTPLKQTEASLIGYGH